MDRLPFAVSHPVVRHPFFHGTSYPTRCFINENEGAFYIFPCPLCRSLRFSFILVPLSRCLAIRIQHPRRCPSFRRRYSRSPRYSPSIPFQTIPLSFLHSPTESLCPAHPFLHGLSLAISAHPSYRHFRSCSRQRYYFPRSGPTFGDCDNRLCAKLIRIAG